MAEKPSPAQSASSATGSVATPQSRNSPTSRLIVAKQPPTHIFADAWFEVEFDVEMVKGKGSLNDAEFVLTLHHQKSRRPTGDDVAFTAVPPGPVRFSSRDTSPKRKRRLRCKILPKDVRQDKAAAFFIQLSLKDSSCGADIMPASTRQVNVVNYMINITVNDEWEPVWYKDEGGRDKCMTIDAVLLNREGSLCVGEQVPLQMTLYYDHADQPVKVGKQSIFRVIGPLTSKTDKRTGRATLKFRVDDVSKNHQGQDFRVEVAPDANAKGFQDVAPGFSPAVSIRSKRNKRQRLGSTSRSEPSRYSTSPISSQQARMPGSMRDEPLLGSDAPPFRGVEVSRLRDAMKGVMQWTEEVVNGLYPLQWQVIGYAQNPDGSPDFSRPYHSMQNPNECISRVLSMYSEVTREHLMFLMNAVEGSGPSLQGNSVVLPRTVPRLPDDAMMAAHVMPPFPMDPRIAPRGPFLPPGHPMAMSIPPDVFRVKGDSAYPLQALHGLPQSPMQAQNMAPQNQNQLLPGSMMRMDEIGGMPMSSHAASLPQQSVRIGKSEPLDSGQMQAGRSFDDDNRESEVAYVLAKQFKATRTGERLGFPAYSESKEILGFYRESSIKVGVGQFLPISRLREDFGPLEIMEATEILNKAMENKSDAVHALKEWGSISNLIDHALVYDWTKDIGTGTGDSSD